MAKRKTNADVARTFKRMVEAAARLERVKAKPVLIVPRWQIKMVDAWAEKDPEIAAWLKRINAKLAKAIARGFEAALMQWLTTGVITMGDPESVTPPVFSVKRARR